MMLFFTTDPKSPPSLRGVKLLFKAGRLSKRTVVAGVLHAGQDSVGEERLELSEVVIYSHSRLPRPFSQ